MDNDERLYDEIADLQDENQILREVRDDLLDENERLRKEIFGLKKSIEEVS